MTNYDIIITGAGCSGLLLAMALLKHDYQGNILVIDRHPKNINDRTWSFWESEENELEHLVSKKWSNIIFNSPNFRQHFNIHPYQYKVIKSIDFYQLGMSTLYAASNVHFTLDNVTHITDDGRVILEKGEPVKGQYVFNSTHSWKKYPIQQPYHLLLQHFYGWVVESETEVFDDTSMTYMDFDIPQLDGGAHFMYLLPYTKKKALIEYTVFSRQKLKKEVYKKRLEKHIEQKLNLRQYSITEEEFGIIPMTNYPFPMYQSDQVFNIGTSAGFTKASTGYAFVRSQEKARIIAQHIVKKKPLLPIFTPSLFHRFRKYDATLLNILYHRKYNERDFFVELFQKKGAKKVLKFLDEKTNIFEELDIVNISPKWIFFRAFLEEIFVSIR